MMDTPSSKNRRKSIQKNTDSEVPGMMPIHIAAREGDVSLLSDLISEGANINLINQDNGDWRPIHYAIFHNNRDAVDFLLRNGAIINEDSLKGLLSASQRVLLSRQRDMAHQL